MGSVEEHLSTSHRKRQVSSTQQTSISYTRKVANGALKDSCLTDDEKRGSTNDKKSEEQVLKERGINLVDSDLRNFSNITPSEVTDYYKGLGDWQNILPKTDYAYSPVSIFNKKKINGIYPVLPNMSRRKLWNSEYEPTELTDRQTVTMRSEHHSYMSRGRWFIHKEDPAVVEKSYNRAPSYSNSSFNLRQWISSKRSSFLQSSTKLYERWHSYFKKIRTRSAVDSSSSSSSWRKILVQYVFPFLLLFLISYLFLWSPFPASSLSPIDYVCKCSSVVYTYVSQVIESLFSLVHHSVDFTLTSATFNLSCISWPGDLSLKMIPNLILAPVYHVFWSFVTPEEKVENTKTENIKFQLDDAQIEQLFQKFRQDSSTLELSRKIENIDKKLKDFEDRHARAYEKLLSDHTFFQERLKTLESLMAESKVDEKVEKLHEEMEKLREEIRSKETKIQNDFYILLSSVLRVDPDKEGSFDRLRAKFVAIFRSIEEAHFKVDKLNEEFFNYVNNASDRIEIAVERSGERIKFDLRSFVEELAARKMNEWKRASSDVVEEYDGGDLEKYVKKIVQKALDVYDADKTGMADYALESSGGIILSTRCTETKKSQAQISILGVPFWYTSSSPRTVIQPNAHPGECWAFPGSTGYLVIQLSKSIFITGVSLEHIPKAIAQNGTIDSAPKDFSVWALRSETDPEAKLLGTFQYDDNGPSVQSYDVIPLDQPYEIVELKILSNYGKIDYTCLYRFRVHGIPA